MNISELWKQYKIDKSVKEAIVTHYIYIVKTVVNRIMPTFSGYVDKEDLIGYGIIGLIESVDRFDPGKNIDFEHFAKIRIRGEIIDNLRKMDWASVSLRGKIKEITNATQKLRETLKREPDEEEIAQKLGVDIHKLSVLRNQIHMFNIVNFESMIDENSGIYVFDILKDEKAQEAATILERNEFSQALAKAVDTLKEKEQLVIKLYYFNELKIKEIALVLDISESRVSQIHSGALKKLKDLVSDK